MPIPALPEHLAASAARVKKLGRNVTSDVYIGRAFAGNPASEWANTHRMVGNSDKARATVLVAYWDDLVASGRVDDVAQLAGRTLGCWCAPKPCHGHLLAAAADGHVRDVDAWVDDLREFARTAPYRLLVTGSREWADPSPIADALNAQHRAWGRPSDAILVHGAARGADALAADAWARAGLPAEPHPYDHTLGKRGGPIRNQAMVDSGIDACVAFPIGESRGTRGCIKMAQAAGIPVAVTEGRGQAPSVPTLF